ncbi:MAG: hypothetical protein KDD85_05805 [Parvularculaceae bacterium]|nr:hypothetical protein [Parvularculaceae bacterium]
MKVGVSGHRDREGADWDWVRAEMEAVLERVDCTSGASCLAPGADMIFAEIILTLGRELTVMTPVAPSAAAAGCNEKEDALIAAASKVRRIAGANADEAFFNAGKAVVDDSDLMIFVWDGGPSRGLGGTADIVAYARECNRRAVILDPLARTVRDLA